MPNEPEQFVLRIDEPIPFYSQADEDHFFAWLQSIPAVKNVVGVGRDLEMIIQLPIDKEGLHDLIAVMTRYSLDRRSLKPLCDQHQDEYFRDAGKYWHSAVYG